MADEPQATASQEAAAPAAPELPDLDPEAIAAVLNRYQDAPDKRAALVDKLRTHPLVANIAGDLAERQRREREQEAARKAIEDEQARLRKLADEDPETFASELKVRWDKEAADKRVADLRATTRQEFIQRLGTALKGIPEATELTAEEHARLTKALAGATEDDVLPIFQRFMTDLVADKRAAKKADEAIAERLKAERKAWEKEQADKRLKARPTPSVGTSPTGTAQDTGEPKDFLSPEWAAWYDRQRKAGALARR